MWGGLSIMRAVFSFRVHPMSQSRIEDTVEIICQRGCRYVNKLLADPAQQQACSDLDCLDDRERGQVLEELRSVMAVYQITGSCDI